MADTNNIRCRKSESNDNNFVSVTVSSDSPSSGHSPQISSSYDNIMNSKNTNVTYKTATEYGQAVHQWLVQYHLWNQMNWFYMTFPMQLMNYQAQYSCYSYPNQQNIPVPGTTNQPNGLLNNANRPQFANLQQVRTQPANQQAVQFKIPPLWKRVAAEFLDFFLLFITKLVVTIFFVEYVGLVDLHHYDFEYLMTTDMDYNTAFTMTSELVAMEIVNRVFICIFETLCLRRGLGGTVGGTTPGKRIFGLKVISCREVSSLRGRKVLVAPAGNIGTWNAFVRSLIKNFSLAFFFPVCLTVFFFQYNRAAYDIISNSIVVETDQLPE